MRALIAIFVALLSNLAAAQKTVSFPTEDGAIPERTLGLVIDRRLDSLKGEMGRSFIRRVRATLYSLFRKFFPGARQLVRRFGGQAAS